MRKKVLSLCLALVMVLALLPATLAAQSGDGWNLDDNGKLTITADQPGPDYGFSSYAASVTEIEIGQKVKTIGDNAFKDFVNVTKVHFAKEGQGNSQQTTTIGAGAFSGCTGITEITLPSRLDTIGDGAFAGCTNLTTVNVEARSTDMSIGEGVFAGCSPNLTFNGENTTLIGELEENFETPVTPEVSGCGLVLDGMIGVMFYVSSSVDLKYVAATYTVGSDTTEKTAVYDAENGAYVCYVTALQMADTVTLSLTDTEYTVQSYIEYVQAHSSEFEPNVVTLVNALADYGYYAQQYLIPLKNLTGYTAMSTDFSYSTYDYDEILADVDSYKAQKGAFTDPTVAAKITFSLSMDSDTALNIYIAPTDSDAAVSAAGYNLIQDGRRSVIRIENIAANELYETYDIELTVGSTTDTISISPLSYVWSVLSGDYDAAFKDAVCAIYEYAMAAQAYLG